MSRETPKDTSPALPARPTNEAEHVKASGAIDPSINAVLALDAYKGNVTGDNVDTAEMVMCLRSTIQEIQKGDLSTLEAMLVSQATALQTMFTSIARRAANQQQLKHHSVLMGLALKAQAQSRATITALVDLKYPRQATFIKQANVAHGAQQVNNNSPTYCSPAHARENNQDQTKLLEADHHGGTSVDRRATAAAARGNQAVETVGALNRPANRRGKGKGVTQR